MLPSDVEIDSEDARAQLLRELLNQALDGPSSQLGQCDPKKLGARELPPETWGGIFTLYQAHCLAVKERPASRALFYMICKKWRRCLTFRSKSQHSTCLTCDRLKAKLRHSKNFVDHAAASDSLLGHLATTWRCREVYWSARQQSRSHSGSLLTLIVDGYDKSKPSLPRWGRGRTPKGGVYDRVQRAHLNVSAVIAHGFGALIFVANEGMSCGGSYTWECLLHACNEVWLTCCRSGRPMPRSFLGGT